MNIATFQPRGPTVLVQREELTKEQTGGIIVPGNEYGNFAFARVIAVGPGTACVSRDTYDEDTSAYMADTEDLTIGDLILMKTGNDAAPLSQRPKFETTLPFTVGGMKVELIEERYVVAIVTKSEDSA